MKNAHRKLEIPMPGAMPCKTPINSGGETYGSIGKSKTKHACIVAADESMRFGMEGAPRRYHEDHIAGKGTNTFESLQSCAQIYSCASSNETSRC